MNNQPLLQLKSVSFTIDKNTKLVSDIDLTIVMI